jgi:CHAT domain-containing protein
MRYVHEELRQGRDKALAVQAAKRRLREDFPVYDHPYYWAPFILLGTWQRRLSSPAQA